MSLSDFINELQELEKEYGDLDIPWSLERTDKDELRPIDKLDMNLSEVVTINMDRAHAVKLSEESKIND